MQIIIFFKDTILCVLAAIVITFIMHGWLVIIRTLVCLQNFCNSCNNINLHHCSMHPERQDLLKMVLQHPVRQHKLN